MREFINIVDNITESLDDYDPPTDTPDSVTEFKGLTFKEQKFQGYQSFYVYRGDTMIGFVLVARDAYDPEVMRIHPDLLPDHQRKGYGTIIYDFSDALAHREGRKVTPSSIQSDAAKAFWAKRTRQ